jgi:hypothetical protein
MSTAALTVVRARSVKPSSATESKPWRVTPGSPQMRTGASAGSRSAEPSASSTSAS